MKISIVTPSVRPDFLPIVGKCLIRQTLKDFEWLIGVPSDKRFGQSIKELKDIRIEFDLMNEPDKREGDFYGLNKCWNMLFSKAHGELIVSIVDGLWFPPTTLEHLWRHYEANPTVSIGLLGNQYDQIINGKPEHLVWRDPRENFSDQMFFETEPLHFELCLASIPKKAIYEVEGIKEIYDTGAALSEKEMCIRIGRLGYKFFFDKSIEYRAIKHERLHGTEEWDKHYQIAQQLFSQHLKEIEKGQGTKGDLKLDNLTEKEYKKENGVSSEKESPAIS